MNNIWISGFRLFFLLVLTNIIGYVGSGFMTPDSMNWYDTLKMSSLTPPNYVFGIVWSILFVLMSVAAWLVWGKASPRWFVLQLIANMAWTFSFFYLRSPLTALVIILLLICFVYKTITSFWQYSRASGLLMVPTLIWSFFALYLNAYIVWYN